MKRTIPFSKVPPNHHSLTDQEEWLAMREYWDGLGAEWNNHSVEEKLIHLANFVQQGGNLRKVINQYAKYRDERYTQQIQYAVLHYICELIHNGDAYTISPFLLRVKRLDKNELVRLLVAELKRCISKTCQLNAQMEVEHCWEITDDYQLNDKNLDRIERAHWRKNPEETMSAYLRKSDDWDVTNLWAKKDTRK